jgi:hypothetical protein
VTKWFRHPHQPQRYLSRCLCDKGANDLADDFVRGFNDSVCSRCVCRDADRFDAGLGKSKLKGVTNKLRAVVIDKPIGARVTRQLMVLGCCRLFWDLAIG